MDQYKNFINESKDVKDALSALDKDSHEKLKEAFYGFDAAKYTLELMAKSKHVNPTVKKEIEKCLKGQNNFLGKYL